MPVNPGQYYKNGYNSMGDWLGTGSIANHLREYRSFEEARAFARKLNLKSGAEWRAFCKGGMPELGLLPADIPSTPGNTYTGIGWNGIGDWLGTGAIANQSRKFLPFEEARAFARKLNLKSGAEWVAFCKGQMPELGLLPADIPASPVKTYAENGWNGMGDWLGTGNVATSRRKFRPFLKARAFARKLNLKSGADWVAFCKGQMPELGLLPADIPSDPGRRYADNGWEGMGDWLGTGSIANHLREYRSFEEARAFARKLNLKSGAEWRAFCKGGMPELGLLPADIPSTPGNTYADNGWNSIGDWLGTGAIANHLREYRPFEEARAFARKLNLKSGAEWKAFSKGQMPELGLLPADIPANLRQHYSGNGWEGMGDWLGTGKVSNLPTEIPPLPESPRLRPETQPQRRSRMEGVLQRRDAEIRAVACGHSDKSEIDHIRREWLGRHGRLAGNGTCCKSIQGIPSLRGSPHLCPESTSRAEPNGWRSAKARYQNWDYYLPTSPQDPGRRYAEHGWEGWPDCVGTGCTRFSKAPKHD